MGKWLDKDGLIDLKTRIKTKVDTKVDKYTEESAGKFLQTDSNGNAVWGTAASPSAVAAAAEQWMEDNTSAGVTLAIDSSLTREGFAADAKATGELIKSAASQPSTSGTNVLWINESSETEYQVPTQAEFDDLKSALVQNYANVVNIEKGGWSTADGTPLDNNNWCRTNKFINKNLIVRTSTVNMWMQAYDNRTGAYVGGWNGTEFSTTYDSSLKIRTYNIAEFSKNYPNYMFAISFKTGNLTLADLYAELVVENATDLDVQDVAAELHDVDNVLDCKVYQVDTSSVVETPTGTRLRIVKRVVQGSSISVRCTYGKGAIAYIYATEYDAIYATSNYIQSFGVTSYTTEEHGGIALYNGYLSISEMKTDGISISTAEKSSFLSATTVLIEGKYSGLYKRLSDSSFVVKNELANGTIVNPANANAVRTVDYVSVYPGDTVTFGTNKPFKNEGNYYSYGYQTYDANKTVVRNLNYTSSTTDNTLKIEDGEYYVRFVICEYKSNRETVPNRVEDYDGYDVTVSIDGSLDVDRFYFLYNKITTDDEEKTTTEELNKDMDSALAAMSRINTYQSGSSGYKKNFSLAIITDVHGSANAFSRFIKYVNSKKKYFDVALCTGDIVEDNPYYDVSWFTSALSKTEIPFLFTVGNHDIANTGSAGISQAEARTRYFAGIESKEWILPAEFIGSGKCSWVKDFSDYKIRVISPFEYGNSETIATDAPASYCRRWMDSELLQWFADTLYSTPDGYSVIVLLHQVPNNQVNYIDDKFTAVHGIRQEPPHILNTMNGNPIEDIVNAFMNSTEIDQSYTSNSYIPGKTATVSKDFSGRSENGSFICYVCGHAHISYVLQSTNYQDQKTIVVNTGSENIYQRQYSDTNYDPDTRNKDCFYGIGFDTERRTINLVQIGGQETIDMRKRDFTAIPY